MNKKFIINLGILLLLNFLVKPFYILGIDGEIQNRVGQEIYGQYFSLISFTIVLNIFLDLGTVNYNTRNIAQNQFLFSKYFGHIIGLRFILALFFSAIVFIAWLLVGYPNETLFLLIWIIINHIIAGFIVYVRSNLSGLHLFKQDSIISVLDRFLLVVICSILLWGGITKQAFKIEWLVYAQTFAYTITLIISLIFLFAKQKSSRIKLNKVISLSILKESLPYALLILLMGIYYRSDSVMLERLLPDGKQQAGIYANAFRFFEAAFNMASLFAVILLPVFSRLIKQKQSIESLLSTASRILLSGSILLGVICWFFQKELMQARYDLFTEQSAPVFSILMICFFFVSVTYLFGTLLTAKGNLKTLNKIALSGAVINIILNFILIPYYKAYGAAVASLVSQFLTAVLQFYVCRKEFNLTYNAKLINSLVVFSVCIITISFTTTYYLSSSYNWIILILLNVCIGIVLLFATRVLSIFHLKTLILSYKNKYYGKRIWNNSPFGLARNWSNY